MASLLKLPSSLLSSRRGMQDGQRSGAPTQQQEGVQASPPSHGVEEQHTQEQQHAQHQAHRTRSGRVRELMHNPLFAHLTARGFPLGGRTHSAQDNFAQVLRESLEQPHLSSTTLPTGGHAAQHPSTHHHSVSVPTRQASQHTPTHHPSVSLPTRHASLPTGFSPPSRHTPPKHQHRPPLSHSSLPTPHATSRSPLSHSSSPAHQQHQHKHHHHVSAPPPSSSPAHDQHHQHPVSAPPTSALTQQRVSEASSGSESDDEGSSSSSSSASMVEDDEDDVAASFCSCSSSVEDGEEAEGTSALGAEREEKDEGAHEGLQPSASIQTASTSLHSAAAFSTHSETPHTPLTPPKHAHAHAHTVQGRKSVHQHRSHHSHQHSHHSHHHHHRGSRDGEALHPAVEAFLQGSLAFAFSGGGFFFPYSLGCVIQLADMGIINDRTPLAGASCGAIIVACVNSGLDLHGLVPQLLEFAADCRALGTAGHLRYVIEKFMRRALPPDAHLRCRDTCYISLTKVFPYLKTVVISDYIDKEDLVSAIATSCHIPAYNDGSFVKEFRGQYFVDGGLLRHIPALPLDHPASYVAGVSCVPFKFLESLPGVQRLRLLRSLAVSPDMFGTFPFGWSEVGGLVLAPAADPVLLQMVEMGKQDIKNWVAAVGLGPYLPKGAAAAAGASTPQTPAETPLFRTPKPSLSFSSQAAAHSAAVAAAAAAKQARAARVKEAKEAGAGSKAAGLAHASSVQLPISTPKATATPASSGSNALPSTLDLMPYESSPPNQILLPRSSTSSSYDGSRSKASAPAPARRNPWATAKAPFVRMASALTMRTAATLQGQPAGAAAPASWADNSARNSAHSKSADNGARGVRGKGVGVGVGARGDEKARGDDKARAVGVERVSSGSSLGSDGDGSLGVGGEEDEDYDSEEDILDLLRWLWVPPRGEGRDEELDSGYSSSEEDEELEDREADDDEAEGWVMDAAIAAANAAASSLAGLPSAAASALSGQNKYVRAAAMAAAMATAAAAHSAGLPVAGAAAAAAAAVGVARREALRNMLQAAGRQVGGNVRTPAALRELLLQVGSNVPAPAVLRELLQQVGGNVPSRGALRELLLQFRDNVPMGAALHGYTATLLQQARGNVPSRTVLRNMLQQARGNVPSRDAVRDMLQNTYLQYVGGGHNANGWGSGLWSSRGSLDESVEGWGVGRGSEDGCDSSGYDSSKNGDACGSGWKVW